MREPKHGGSDMGQGILMPNGSEVESVPDTSALMAEAGLSRAGSSLHMSGVPLTRIAEAVGTPTYVYNAEVIRDRYRRLSAAFAGTPHRICYAVKANSSLAILRLLRDLGAGADLVSAGEMHRTLAAGFSPEHLVFSGVGKTNRGRGWPDQCRISRGTRSPRGCRRRTGSPGVAGPPSES